MCIAFIDIIEEVIRPNQYPLFYTSMEQLSIKNTVTKPRRNTVFLKPGSEKGTGIFDNFESKSTNYFKM